jgi:hypothetical protein
MRCGRRPIKWAALACWAATAVSAAQVATAQTPDDPPLSLVRTWALAEDDLARVNGLAATHRMRLEMAVLRGSGWDPDAILAATRAAARILAQCGIRTHFAELYEFDGPPRYLSLFTPVSRDLARRTRLARPAIFFVADSRNRPAFDAEAVGRANSRSRPEMANSVWVVAGARDLPVVLAHELAHVLADSGEHSDAPGNLMREETAMDATAIAPEQCRRMLAAGTANGLLQPLTH